MDDSNLAPGAAGAGAMLQIVAWVGVLEFWSNKGKVTMMDMFDDPKRVPGDIGFDPMGLAVGKGEDAMERMRLRGGDAITIRPHRIAPREQGEGRT